MNYPKYDISTSESSDVYKFVSNGTKGNIEKIIEFSPTQNTGVYNLAFGDVKADGTLDDDCKSRNGDMDTVLATVAAAVYEYTATFPDRQVIFAGSSPGRTRLYRMALTKHYAELNEDFHIFGLKLNGNELSKNVFENNDDYVAFLVERKSINLAL